MNREVIAAKHAIVQRGQIVPVVSDTHYVINVNSRLSFVTV